MIRLLLVVATFYSCVNGGQESSLKRDSTSREVLLSHEQEVSVVSDKETIKAKVFQYLNDSVEQKILIKPKGDNEIYFEYFLRNKNSHCVDSVKGVAINRHPDDDPELDEDEEGFGYPSLEYIYEKNKNYLAIRIAMKTEDKIVIKASGFKNNKCNYESIGILRLVGGEKL